MIRHLYILLQSRLRGILVFPGMQFLVLILLSFGCSTMPELDIDAPDDLIVVDGSIEQGSQARVFLTRNAPYFSTIDSASLRELVLSRAKVTLTDGERSEVLILRKDMRFFPPFYYAGNDIIGKAGGTYTLRADFGGKSVTAITTIPEPVAIDTAFFVLQEPADSSGYIDFTFSDPADQKNYYRIFTRVLGKDTRFISAFIIAIDDQFFSGQQVNYTLYRAPESFLSSEESDSYRSGDTVVVKLCNMDEGTFNFWNTYQEEAINATNPFASSMINLDSNIEGEGLGVWSGYGVTIDTVICR